MKFSLPSGRFRPQIVLIFVLGAIALPVASAQNPAKASEADCAPVMERFKKDIAADPGRLILAVEDALTTNELCACRIVTLAISYANADARMTGQITGAAVRIAPAMAPAIVQCAVEAAPAASGEIMKALEKELGENAGTVLAPAAEQPAAEAGSAETVAAALPVPPTPPGGKEPVGKAPAFQPPVEGAEAADDSFGSLVLPVGLTGIYLSPPSSGSGNTVDRRNITGTRGSRTIIVTETVADKPRRPASPVTKSEPE